MPAQAPLFAPECAWRPPVLSELPAWPKRGRICIDTETHDPQLQELGPGVRRGAYMAGIGFAIEDGPSAYVPFAHPSDNVDREQALRYFRDNLRQFEGTIVGARLSYDLDFLWELDLVAPLAEYSDVLLLEPLLDELQHTYNLDAVAARRGLPGKDKAMLEEAAAAYGAKKARAAIADLPARYVGAYGEQDVRLPLQLLRRQERALEDQSGVERCWALERKVLPALVRMTRRGVRVDFEQLARVEQWTLDEERKAYAQVKDAIGLQLSVADIWSAEPLARALTMVGIKVPVTAKNKPSVTKELLASVKHPVAAAISRARKVNKIRTTFAASVHRYQTNGRIHCTFNQMRGSTEDEEEEQGAAYGRLSCADPNLQQQPARDPEIGPMWRAVYVPEPGEEWCKVDYSQQEPRLTLHYAVLTRCNGAEEAAERYRQNPKTDNHQMMADLTGLPRRPAKDIFLGLVYGMGGPKLCRKLELPTRWAVFWDDPDWGGGEHRRYGRPPRLIQYCASSEEAHQFAAVKKRELPDARAKAMEVAGEEGQQLLDTFDEKVPWVKEVARFSERKARERGYVTTLSGRRCRFPEGPHGYDWTHKALNRVVQGGSADQTKEATVAADAEGIPLLLQVHDELNCSCAERALGERLGRVMTDVVRLQVPVLAEPSFGPNWGAAK